MTQRKPPLSIGDKVHVYGRPSPGCGIGAWAGVVVEQNEGPHEGESISVRAEFGLGTFDVHPKQCRRLRPRKREEKPKQEERVTTWCYPIVPGLGPTSKTLYFARDQAVACVHKNPMRLSEIRPGERILSRKELAEAWEKSVSAGTFHRFLTAIGFEEDGK